MADQLSSLPGALQVTVAYGQPTVTVEPAAYADAALAARDDPALTFTYFDFLAGAQGGRPDAFEVVTHLWSPSYRTHLLLRCEVSGPTPTVPTLVGVFRGAAWHERETYEMYGVHFLGHPDLRRLLTPDLTSHPLRKDVGLPAREQTTWPGAHDPAGKPVRRV